MRFLFLSAAFLGAFLLFCVQPMIARMALPQFGGAPAVWNTCLVFFQAMLMAGYATAHAAARWLTPRRHAMAQVALLALPVAGLPFAIPAGTTPVLSPAARLLGLLTVTVGLPFLAVATTAPVLQRWFVAIDHRGARDPYFLYAASNVGSLLALLGYVILIEPSLSLAAQARLWAAGYGLLAVLTLACAVTLWRAPLAVAEPWPREPISARERAHWLVLALAPSSLLLGVTAYMTTDLMAVPLLWVVPLAIYLVSFVIAFSNPPRWVFKTCTLALAPAIVATLAIMVRPAVVPHWLTFPLHLSTFFLAATACHIELARRRPSPGRLTEFYLIISLGGVMGGAFNALLAPLLFRSVAEFPLGLALAAFLIPFRGVPARTEEPRRPRALALDFALPLLLGIAAYAALLTWNKVPPAFVAAAPLVACFCFIRRPLRFALALAITAVCIGLNQERYEHVALMERSFFGVLRVMTDFPPGLNTLMHGRTLHGMERRDANPLVRDMPLSYYFPTGPIGQVFATFQGTPVVDRVGVIGLGVGSLAAYGKKGQDFTFFEIDPAVERIARNPAFFHYLEDSAARWRVITGDARLSLAREPDGEFGLIVVDAFSGDAIPVHLLTREAIRVYLAKLARGGLVALHISNDYLDLLPAVQELAVDAGLVNLYIDETRRPLPLNELVYGRRPSQWVILARRWDDLARLARDPRWQPIMVPSTGAVWTDDYSGLFWLLKWR